MGFLDFLKKKEPEQPKQQSVPDPLSMPISAPSTDLPSLPRPIQQDNNPLSYAAPSPRPSDTSSSASGISFNMPPIDFSLPVPEHTTEGNTLSFAKVGPQDPSSQTAFASPQSASPDYEEDLKRLFPDDVWHEPDWEHFDPYQYSPIEEPKSADFGVVDTPSVPVRQKQTSDQTPVEMHEALPSFDEHKETGNQPIYDDSIIIEKRTHIPLEIFVKERHYAVIYTDLMTLKRSLNSEISRFNNIDELNKRQEPELHESKERMELLYKKLLAIDKKIFA